MGGGLPEEGELFPVHPGLQLQGGILPKGRNDEAEQQGDQHEHSRQHNLKRKPPSAEQLTQREWITAMEIEYNRETDFCCERVTLVYFNLNPVFPHSCV